MRLRRQSNWSYSLQNKEAVRKHILKLRACLTFEARVRAASMVCTLLQNHSLFINSSRIACYFAQEDEISCSSIIRTIWESGKHCFLPVLSAQGDKNLDFVKYRDSDLLRFNRYKILEPDHADKCGPEELDLVLVPLVGFDLEGNRLGMGGGYYDRTFHFLQRKTIKKPFLLGLAYDLQKVESLPCDFWDVKMNGVLTEEKFYIF